MEVENLLEDDKGELPFVEEHRYPKGCISSDGFSSEKAGLESSEGRFYIFSSCSS